MKKEDKVQVVNDLQNLLKQYPNFYVTDAFGLNAEQTFKLRKACFQKNIKLVVVKNTLFKKALEASEGNFEELFGSLKGSSAIMFSESVNAPAQLIKAQQKDKTNNNKPELKAAYVQECVYGADQLDALIALKSKEELLAEIIGLLQSPMQNVMGALQSGGNTIHGVLKTLEARG